MASGRTALTVALVPTGVNAGVRMSPCGVRMTPARPRCAPVLPRPSSRCVTSKEKSAPGHRAIQPRRHASSGPARRSPGRGLGPVRPTRRAPSPPSAFEPRRTPRRRRRDPCDLTTREVDPGSPDAALAASLTEIPLTVGSVLLRVAPRRSRGRRRLVGEHVSVAVDDDPALVLRDREGDTAVVGGRHGGIVERVRHDGIVGQGAARCRRFGAASGREHHRQGEPHEEQARQDPTTHDVTLSTSAIGTRCRWRT